MPDAGQEAALVQLVRLLIIIVRYVQCTIQVIRANKVLVLPRGCFVIIIELNVLVVSLHPSCSGLSRPERGVEQVFLRCAEGSVEFLYPVGALRLTLAPRLQWVGPAHTAGRTPTSVCIKPESQWSGAQLYLERGGDLELLVGDALGATHIRCFSITPGEGSALFLQATPHSDISRRIAAFRYELRGDWTAHLASNSIDANLDREEGVFWAAMICVDAFIFTTFNII